MKRLILLVILLGTLATTPAIAHPGNTAADGAHYCRTRCDYWGVPWNERHSHDGYTPQPVLTYKDWTQDIVIPYKEETRDSAVLDKGQSKIVQVGVAGKAVDKWRENFSDGKKIGETTKVRTTVTEPVAQITEIGTREPAAPIKSSPTSSSNGDSGLGAILGIGTIAGVAYLVKRKSRNTRPE